MASSSKAKPISRSGKSTAAPKSPESFQSLNERNNAVEILQSYEKLSWFSMQRCENIVAGFTADDEAALVDWVEDLTPRGEATKKGTGKGKERVSEIGVSGGVATASAGGGSGGNAKKKRKSDGRVVL